MSETISREAALALLRQYNKEPFLLRHALTVEAVMGWFARQNGEDETFWKTVGLLHDVDYGSFPEQHCQKAPELLREAAPITITCYDENAVRACASPLTLRKGRVTAETGTFLLNHGFEEWYHSVTGFAPSDNIHECLMP